MPSKRTDFRPSHVPEEEVRGLWEKNRHLVTWWMDKYLPPLGHHEWDDLFQEGCLGLHRAIINWNPSKGTLSTYAVGWIRCFVWRAKNRDLLIAIPVMLPKACGRGEALKRTRPRSMTQSKTAKNAREARARKVMDRVAEEDEGNWLLGLLPQDHRDVIELTVMEGLTTAEAADILDLTEASVAYMKQRALSWLRAEMKERGRVPPPARVKPPAPNSFTIDGETKTLEEWAAAVGVPVKTLKMRLSRGWSLEEALATTKNFVWGKPRETR